MPERITSVHNPRIRQAVKLRHRDEREVQRRSLIDGTREISRALDAGIDIVDLFVCEPSLRAESLALLERAVQHGLKPCYVSPAVHEKLAFGDRHEGLVATFCPPQRALADLIELPTERLVAVLAGIEKPGNVGAVIRSADATGISALIVADGGTDLFNPNAIRASLGTIFSLPLVAASSAATLNWLRAQRMRIFATRVGSGEFYADVPLNGRAALVLGNEAAGLSAVWASDDITPITLPMLGVADSLNVSVTAGVLFYEALRQRRVAGRRGGTP